MSLRLAYLLVAFAGLVAACVAPQQAGSGARGSSPKSGAVAKIPHTPLSYDLDTLIVDSRDSILLDAIGQLYYWSADNRIEKVRSLNQIGQEQEETDRLAYQNPRLGRLTSVDFTNPIRPLLFYQDAQTVIWLNRNLSEWRSVNLLDLGFSAIDAVAYAPNEGLWLYASDQQKLLQVDLNGKIVYQSAELNQVFNQGIRGEQLVANAQQVAMRTQSNRLLLFGPFGGYRSELIRGGTSLHLAKDRLVFYEGQQWWAYRGSELPVEKILSPKGGKELVSLRAEYALYRRGNRYWRAIP